MESQKQLSKEETGDLKSAIDNIQCLVIEHGVGVEKISWRIIKSKLEDVYPDAAI